MDLPKRVAQHISETESYKIFSTKIPSEWIIRDVTERDYGIDCYLELVSDKNEVLGRLALIQLKAKASIPWTKENTFKLSSVEISTTNYWYRFAVPVFIFLVDLAKKEVYFLPVKHHIRQHFDEYIKQSTFSYTFSKDLLFEGKAGASLFLQKYYQEYHRNRFESEFLFFLSNLEKTKEFLQEHSYRDYHLGLEETDQIFFEAIHRNFLFLAYYLGVQHDIPLMDQIKENSRNKFGNEYHYELYEHDLIELSKDFEALLVGIINGLKDIILNEDKFWMITEFSIFKFIDHIADDGAIIYD